MKKNESLRVPFFVFLFLSILIFGLSKTGILNGAVSVLGKATAPLQSITFQSFNVFRGAGNSSKVKVIEETNRELLKQLVGQQALKAENDALHDQFQVANPRSKNLLPARIVGAPSFIPGVTEPSSFIIDKGTSDNISVGDAVVFKDNLIGKIGQVNMYFSKVFLITDRSSLISAKILGKGTDGVINGEGKQMILNNVVQSSDLKISDIVVSKGDLDLKGRGYPPDLVIGKVMSVKKTPSALFQKAEVASLIDFSSLSIVFITRGQ